MIKSTATGATEQFLRTGKSKFSGLDVNKAKRRVGMLHNAKSLDDLSPLKSVGLHKLSGDRKGQWAMTINGPSVFSLRRRPRLGRRNRRLSLR